MMDFLIHFFTGLSPMMQGLVGALFTWFITALGASMVFFIKDVRRANMDVLMGFTGGVMLAASFWSLLNPAIGMAENQGYGNMAWLPVGIGFLAGAFFLFALDQYLPHLHLSSPIEEVEGVKTNWNRTILLVLAITLHNIPEGLAVGVLFGGVAAGIPEASIGGAVALAIGIGLQNFPEGMAVAFPLRRQGISRRKSFMLGQLSAIVEPVAGVIGALYFFVFANYIQPDIIDKLMDR